MARNSNGKSRFGCSTIIGGLMLIGALLILGPQLFGGGGNGDVVQDRDNNDVSSQSVDDGIALGRPVIAEAVDRDGCPIGVTSDLRNVDTFYVVAPDSEIAEGTDVFVRLYEDNVAVEDLPIITADRDYGSTCINFVFETTDGFAFDPGQYEAELWVNGNPYNSVNFDIR